MICLKKLFLLSCFQKCLRLAKLYLKAGFTQLIFLAELDAECEGKLCRNRAQLHIKKQLYTIYTWEIYHIAASMFGKYNLYYSQLFLFRETVLYSGYANWKV